MAEQTLVSIILPVFNSENTISRAIKSVLNQDYSHFELLVIDNNSTDGSVSEISSFADPRIKLHSETKQGVSAARNKGLETAIGHYVCFLDADDELSEQSISSRLKKFEQQRCDFVDGKVEFKGNERPTWLPQGSDKLLESLISLNGDCFCGITWMFKRNLLDGLRFNEDLTHGEDLFFFMQLSKKGGSYAFVDQIVYRVNISENSAMSNLKGIENGYTLTYQSLQEWDIPSEWLQAYRQKARSVMMRTYLKNGQFISALATYRSFLND